MHARPGIVAEHDRFAIVTQNPIQCLECFVIERYRLFVAQRECARIGPDLPPNRSVRIRLDERIGELARFVPVLSLVGHVREHVEQGRLRCDVTLSHVGLDTPGVLGWLGGGFRQCQCIAKQ